MAPCHPGEAVLPTGYLSKNNSCGRARVPLRASTVGLPREPRRRRLSRPSPGDAVARSLPTAGLWHRK